MRFNEVIEVDNGFYGKYDVRVLFVKTQDSSHDDVANIFYAVMPTSSGDVTIFKSLSDLFNWFEDITIYERIDIDLSEYENDDYLIGELYKGGFLK